MKTLKRLFAERRKLAVYVVTAAGCAVDVGLAHGTAGRWALFLIAIGGGYGVHRVPNKPIQVKG